IIVLKSPLGDMRNKLFTRTNGSVAPIGIGNTGTYGVTGSAACQVGIDPFCDPANPAKGDTITFNRAGMGGFGVTDTYTWGTGVQASFGFMAGDENSTNAGRSLSAQSTTVQFRTFANPGFPGTIGIYNKYAPGQGTQPGATWDWNHDGIP